MQIGSFKNVNGNLFGSIATAAINLPRLGLKPVESTNDKAPAFQVMTLNPARRWVEIGALWRAVSNSTGEVFYQGQVDDPSFAQSLSIALFADGEDGFNVAWNRRRRRRDDGFGGSAESGEDAPMSPFDEAAEDEPAAQGRQRRGRRSSGFEGNATEDGQLVDNIPY